MVLAHLCICTFWFSILDIKHRILPKRQVYCAVISLMLFVSGLEWKIVFGNFALYLTIYMLSGGALGFGDVRLSLLIGMYFGYAQLTVSELLQLNFLSWATASVCIGISRKMGKSKIVDSIPFAPFLFIGPSVALLI